MPSILIISNMYPSVEKPYAGVYVKNLYESLEREATLEGVTILAMERKFTGRIGSFTKYLSFLVRSLPYLLRSYDAVHLHFIFPLLIWVYLYKLIHRKSKIIVTCHGSDISQHFEGKLPRFLFSMMIKKVDTVVTVGNDLAHELNVKLDRKADHIIPAGIDEKVFFKMDEIRVDYDLLFVGSFLELKGICELVSSLLSIDRRLNLCFVGSGPLEHLIDQLKVKHNIEICHNLSQVQLRVIYNRAKFLILPSKSEAFGLVVSEAMFCGTPVIGARLGGIQQQLVDGVNGFFIDTVSPERIKAAIDKALSLDSSAYKGLSANALVSNHQFSLIEVCKRYTSIYRGLEDLP